MKRTKFFIIAGTVTLAIASIFGTKPSKKFNAATTAVAGSLGTIFYGVASPHLTTVQSGSLKTAILQLRGGIAQTLKTWGGGTGGAVLYYKP